ncbi:hypothetical protein HXX76_005557 [Chlamydomonas incerta]|uniref:Uncharacterized protein n=1 Tax=Chlamydomonas incerta TaxID=51695 RepID=A0A835T5S9_CHLIN|nr:hypothetical protein HXX76_005557 [Chlamydomonas incerta]|eukprot:KAG2437941.1 hypothetical protein HXX76_005557 [Chlamydomonas incerta]
MAEDSKNASGAGEAPDKPPKDDESDSDSWLEEDEEDEIWESLDDTPQKVDDHLYIGSMAAEHNYDGLKAAGISHVLQVAEGLTPSHAGEGLCYRSVQVSDTPGEDLVAHFKRCFDFIREAHDSGGSVLVHCVAGVSRSATVVMGWLMWRHQLSADEAFRRVHRVRPWVMPNPGFRKQLERFGELGCDLSKWTAWRHEWREEPLTLVLQSFQKSASISGLNGEPLPSL